MSETLTGKILVQLALTLTNSPNALSTPTDALTLSLAQSVTSGTGASQANKLWKDRRTLAAGASESLNLYTCAGATSGVGTTYALSKILAIYIYNRAATASNLAIGGDGTAAAWTSLFNGSNSATQIIKPGGFVLAVAPDASGFAVVNATNHLLKIANADGANPVDYDIVVIGAQ